jgi:hypothetical protein
VKSAVEVAARGCFLAGLLLWIGACRGGGSGIRTAQEAPAPLRGAFEYVANLPGLRLSGLIAVTSDTIIIEPNEVNCRPLVGRYTSSTTMMYLCDAVGRYDAVTFALDRRNVMQWSRWYSSERVTRQRRVCAQFTVTPSGQRVCSRFQMETYEESLGRSGALEVRFRQRGNFEG